MKKITTIAIATLISGTAFAAPHPADEGYAILDRFDMYSRSVSQGNDEITSVHPGVEGVDLLSRYEMYGFAAHDHEHNDFRIERGNPDSTILDDQLHF